MKFDEFWNLSISEVKIFLNAKIEKENEEFRNSCFLAYREADLIAISVSRLLSKKGKYPKISEVFGELFEEKVDPATAKMAQIINTFEAHNRYLDYKEQKDKVINKLISEGKLEENDLKDMPNNLSIEDIIQYSEFLKQKKKLGIK